MWTFDYFFVISLSVGIQGLILLKIIHQTNIQVVCKRTILRERLAMWIATIRHTINRMAIE